MTPNKKKSGAIEYRPEGGEAGGTVNPDGTTSYSPEEVKRQTDARISGGELRKTYYDNLTVNGPNAAGDEWLTLTNSSMTASQLTAIWSANRLRWQNDINVAHARVSPGGVMPKGGVPGSYSIPPPNAPSVPSAPPSPVLGPPLTGGTVVIPLALEIRRETIAKMTKALSGGRGPQITQRMPRLK